MQKSKIIISDIKHFINKAIDNAEGWGKRSRVHVGLSKSQAMAGRAWLSWIEAEGVETLGQFYGAFAEIEYELHTIPGNEYVLDTDAEAVQAVVEVGIEAYKESVKDKQKVA